MDRTEIYAVHKMKLREFLEKLELWEQIQEGKSRCKICEKIITLGNIGLIIPSGNEISLCCSGLDCLFAIRQKQERKK